MVQGKFSYSFIVKFLNKFILPGYNFFFSYFFFFHFFVSKIGGTNLVGAVSAVAACVDCKAGLYRQSKEKDGVTTTDATKCK